MTKRIAELAAERIETRYPQLRADVWEVEGTGEWAVEVKARLPWSADLRTIEEVENFCARVVDGKAITLLR